VLRGSDLAAVRDQLGREPTVAFTVAASCAAGHPLVIRNATRAADGTPFPTTFWLTCPEATRAVSRLESGGAIAALDARIADDPVFTAALEATHAEAAALREAEEPGAGSWGGVGGTRRGLKCLHAHYANHLAGGEDRVGGWVAGRVEPIHPEVRPSRIVAAMDQGTNSTRTLVLAEVGGRRVELARDLVITRLGRDVDATGRVGPAALERVAAVMGRYVRRARALGATSIVTGATSAVRDAANRQTFVDLVREATGAAPEIIDGEREAALSFAGAVDGLDPAGGPYAVCDIGGGSTEVVVGDARGRAGASASLQLGSVRMTERHLHDDPPTSPQLDALRAEVDALLADVQVPVDRAGDLIAVAGTAVTVQAVALGLDRDDPDRIHGSRLDVATAGEVAARLSAMTVAERDALGPMPRGRGEVIAAGAQILHRVLVRFGRADARISETDILDALGSEALRAEAPS
jgi:exopolyphosphatase/guanosine-5'-triphosphate,3'-diphosphate pyrophosphatase